MTISEVKIQLTKPNDGLIGFASVVIDNAIYLGAIGIYNRLGGGYRLTFPKKGAFNIFYPINHQATQILENAIFNKLDRVLGRQAMSG